MSDIKISASDFENKYYASITIATEITNMQKKIKFLLNLTQYKPKKIFKKHTWNIHGPYMAENFFFFGFLRISTFHQKTSFFLAMCVPLEWVKKFFFDLAPPQNVLILKRRACAKF